MAGEPDAGQVVDLALMPVGGAPDAGHRRYLGKLAGPVVLPARKHKLKDETVAFTEAGEVVDNFHVRLEAGLGGFLGVGLEVINAADAIEDAKFEAGIVAEKAADIDDRGGLDDDEG